MTLFSAKLARLAIVGISLFLVSLSSPIQAQSLSDLVPLALKDEPNYQSTVAGLNAAQARHWQAMAALLPQISASANTNANLRTYETRNINLSEQKDRYNSHTWQVNITQPLWRYANLADLQQAHALVSQAQQQMTAAEQNLLAKLVEAWFDVLMARDQVEFTASQEQAAHQQLTVISRGNDLGLQASPQRAEAYAKYLLAQSDNVSAKADFDVKWAALEQLTGVLGQRELPHLHPNPSLPPLELTTLDAWTTLISQNNADIQAAIQAREAAREDVGKQIAVYMPTVDVVGNYASNSQAVGGFPGQNGYDTHQSYVGLQANWALFSSGAQTAKIREARAQLAKADYSVENTRRTIINNTQQAWYSQVVAQHKLLSGQQNVIANRLLEQAAVTGSTTGLKSTADILQAQQQRIAAERDLNKAYYQYLTAFIKLKALANQVRIHDIITLEHAFIEPQNKERL